MVLKENCSKYNTSVVVITYYDRFDKVNLQNVAAVEAMWSPTHKKEGYGVCVCLCVCIGAFIYERDFYMDEYVIQN